MYEVCHKGTASAKTALAEVFDGQPEWSAPRSQETRWAGEDLTGATSIHHNGSHPGTSGPWRLRRIVPMKRRAFTLIELLVVIAIIGTSHSRS